MPRKTVDVWLFFLNYGQGWEHEITEDTREAMKENRKAYRENCPYPLRVIRRRVLPEQASADFELRNGRAVAVA